MDQISATVPIVVFRGRFGTALLNSAALRKAGITRETASFAGVPVPKDQKGELPPMTEEDEERVLLGAIRQRHASGLTSVRDLNLSPEAMREGADS